MITWIQISIALIPMIIAIMGVIVKMQINDRVNHHKIQSLESKVSHVSNNQKQKDGILFGIIDELRKEVHQVSLQLAMMQGKQLEQDKES